MTKPMKHSQSPVMRWRRFADTDDGQVSVTIYETPIGRTCTLSHSRVVTPAFIVTRERAVEMLRSAS